MADKTVYVDGTTSSGHYATLAAAISGEVAANADLTTAGFDNLVIECSDIEDTTAVVVNGFTTNASHKVIIRAATDDLAGYSWSTSKYRLRPTNAVAISVQDGDVWLDGIQVETVSPSTTGKHIIGVNTGVDRLWISRCLLKGHNNGTHFQYGIQCNVGTGLYVWNTILFNLATIANCFGIIPNVNAWIYNTLVIGGYYGIYRFGGTCTAKNVYCGGSSTSDFFGTITKTNCASEDTSADGTNPETGIAYSTANFTNVTSGSEDFRLPAGSGLIDQGVDSSGDSAPMNFTTDMLGNTRTGTWEIGPLEYIAAGHPRMAKVGGLWVPSHYAQGRRIF